MRNLSVHQVGTLAVALVVFGAAENTQNNPLCPCIGSNGQKHSAPNGGVMTTMTVEYAATYGESCGAHAEPGVADCSGADPPAWCSSHWCYVDPCFCEGPSDLGESDYFSSTQFGGKLFYSYEACGSPDQYNSQKCPTLAETACNTDDDCTFSSAACTVSTDKVTTARTSASCSALSFGTYGTACRCTGNNLQERFDVNGIGKVKTTKSGFDHNYPVDYGESCKAHAEPGADDCQGAQPAAWCSSLWCYVDPCECTVDTGIGQSDYFVATVTGSKLFYSYKACGSEDTYNKDKCSTITDTTACNTEDECKMTSGACVVDNTNIEISRTAAGCSPLTGNAECLCTGSNGQTEVTDGNSKHVVTTNAHFSGHKYAADYGEQCSAHAEPGQSTCQGEYPAAWCTSPWCYVDPCTCSDKSIGLSDYFTTTESGKKLYYSYAGCGSKDSYNKDKCTAISTESLCKAEDECTFAANTCTKKADNLETAKTSVGCDAASATLPAAALTDGTIELRVWWINLAVASMIVLSTM